MYSELEVCLAVLCGLSIGACFGVVIGGMNRATHKAELAMQFNVPLAHREVEHECDAHAYPRVDD